ncbi:MAG: DNA alkylation repair protein [Chloroflexota bacterium]
MPERRIDARTFLPEITQRLRQTSHKTEPLRALRREFSRRLKNAEPRSVVRLATTLRESGVVHRFFADELIANHEGAMASLTKRDIEMMGKGMDTWDKVDCFGTIVAGPAWRMGLLDDATIAGWARSRDRWWRRAALVCTTRLNVAGTKGDAKRTLAVCGMLLDDRDDMVVKAMSWALRSLAERDPKSAERFVTAQRGRLAPRVLREVGNKLRTGLKTPTPARPLSRMRKG